MSCVMMPISGTTINGCDCPGSTPANGVLIDGDIPSIDTTQSGTWASQMFVVNRKELVLRIRLVVSCLRQIHVIF